MMNCGTAVCSPIKIDSTDPQSHVLTTSSDPNLQLSSALISEHQHQVQLAKVTISGVNTSAHVTRPNCMFKSSQSQNAANYFSFNPPHSADQAQAAAWQIVDSGGNCNSSKQNHFDRMTADTMRSTGSSSTNTPLWSYPPVIFVPDSYYSYNTHMTQSNHLPKVYWPAHANASESYRSNEQAAKPSPPNQMPPINSSTDSSESPTNLAGLQYDHEPTYADLMPIRRCAIGDNNSGNIQAGTIQTTTANISGYRYGNFDSSFYQSSSQLHQKVSYGNQTIAVSGYTYGNKTTADSNVPFSSDGTYCLVNNSVAAPSDGASMPVWYGGALQTSLSAPSLLALGNIRTSRPANLLATSKPTSPINSYQQHGTTPLNGSTWSLASGSMKSSANHELSGSAGNLNGSLYQSAKFSTLTQSGTSNKLQFQGKTAPQNSSNRKLFICYICSKAYARPSTLRMHMRIHSGVRPYHCRICNKSFCQTANLSAHLRTHNGDKPFACPMCHRKFSQSSSVKTHMRVHTGQRPYKCQACSKTFSDSSTLAKHRRTHNGDRPYMCSVCYLRFTQSGNLNRHMRIHRGQGADQKDAA